MPIPTPMGARLVYCLFLSLVFPPPLPRLEEGDFAGERVGVVGLPTIPLPLPALPVAPPPPLPAPTPTPAPTPQTH
ncbi:hypothetical protein PNOK_0653400 [Pyrrhoderma noxium]|uniref:Uncharacterized protein n=1 Tax=Pyrrhoderma noxium TaxID=2282107 RepID=A0A286UES0_9AGAM|nr:hypothetical protein PNOK_0653400 [Pyrrhoderma noxium]